MDIVSGKPEISAHIGHLVDGGNIGGKDGVVGCAGGNSGLITNIQLAMSYIFLTTYGKNIGSGVALRRLLGVEGGAESSEESGVLRLLVSY